MKAQKHKNTHSNKTEDANYRTLYAMSFSISLSVVGRQQIHERRVAISLRYPAMTA